MQKRQTAFYLALGIIAGLLLTACAGVAVGKIDLPDSNNVFLFGPAPDVLQVPAVEPALQPAPATQSSKDTGNQIDLQPRMHRRSMAAAPLLSAPQIQSDAYSELAVEGLHGGSCQRP